MDHYRTTKRSAQQLRRFERNQTSQTIAERNTAEPEIPSRGVAQAWDDGSMPVSERSSTLQSSSFSLRKGNDADTACRDVNSNISIDNNMKGGVMVYPASCTSSGYGQITAGYTEMAVDDSASLSIRSLGMGVEELERVAKLPDAAAISLERPERLTLNPQHRLLKFSSESVEKTLDNTVRAETADMKSRSRASLLKELSMWQDGDGERIDSTWNTVDDDEPDTREHAHMAHDVYMPTGKDTLAQGQFRDVKEHALVGQGVSMPTGNDTLGQGVSMPTGKDTLGQGHFRNIGPRSGVVGYPPNQDLFDQPAPGYPSAPAGPNQDAAVQYPFIGMQKQGLGLKDHDGPPPEMVKILDIESNSTAVKAKLDNKAIDEIVKSRTCQDLPFLVLSINGKKRTGKSFTVNLMISFLQHLEKNTEESWLATDPEISGVDWRKSRSSVTTGIWMWNKPFVIKCGFNKIAVLLMDCQGLFDQLYNSSDTVDAIVTLCGLEMSKVNLLNINGDVTASDLKHLHNCITFAGTGGTKTLFSTLILVHRDWEQADDDDDDDDDDEGMFGVRQNYFEYVKTKRRLNETEEIVSGAFKECMEFMLPRPGKKIRKGNVDQKVHLQDLLKESDSKKFLKYIEVLFQMVFVSLGSDKKYLVDQKDLLNAVKRLNDRFADDKGVTQFESVAEVMEKRHILDFYDEFKSKFLRSYVSAISVEKYDCKKKLEKEIARCETEAVQLLSMGLEEIPSTTKAADAAKRMVRTNAEKWFRALRDQKQKDFTHKIQSKDAKMVAAGVVIATAAGLAAGPVGWGILAAEATALGMGAASVGAGAAAGAAVKVAGEGVVAIKNKIKNRNDPTKK